MFVIVNGLPGSGKSTLAVPLARELGLPLIAKDVIKDVFLEEFGDRAATWSGALGRGSIAAMYALAATCRAAVLDSFFSRAHAPADLGKLPGGLVEVFCRCPSDLARRRYLERAAARHPGHAEADLDGAFDGWISAGQDQPLGLSPVVEVDTSGRVDISGVARWVLSAEPSSRSCWPWPMTPRRQVPRIARALVGDGSRCAVLDQRGQRALAFEVGIDGRMTTARHPQVTGFTGLEPPVGHVSAVEQDLPPRRGGAQLTLHRGDDGLGDVRGA
ncbi:AAA family ATPase [Streptosporangium sp. CA-115845]|uniref:AAA family ATPase n=1 Tax=Streptosporangium sp. CA-115845 TaxID=3240071 RepID=UPI003D928C94